MFKIIPVTALSDKQRRSFSCGEPSLDTYLKRFAKTNHLKNIGKTFVLIENESSIVGYYTTSMSHIDFEKVPQETRKKLPRYPIPVARIGRLAIDQNYQGKGWGKFLLVDALDRIKEASAYVAAYGVIVDAKIESAKNFYLYFGFTPLTGHDLTLFLIR